MLCMYDHSTLKNTMQKVPEWCTISKSSLANNFSNILILANKTYTCVLIGTTN